MDYRRLLEQHTNSGADGVTVACVPVPVEDSASYGVLGVDDRGRVCSFIEKPLPSTPWSRRRTARHPRLDGGVCL